MSRFFWTVPDVVRVLSLKSRAAVYHYNATIWRYESVEDARARGIPLRYRVGRHVVYKRDEILAYLEAQAAA